ncbi:MAG: hypothetical protein SFV32_03755 [Opitutaceae bacterium]|nr:hypothetical protein [Opitutaceae bacterium]
MTSTEALQHHLSLCDELHALALEENRFLKQNQRVPDSPLLEKKRLLLGRLDESLRALKAANAVAGESSRRHEDSSRKEILERAKARILQVMHLDRENEQLLLRYSLGVRSPRTPSVPTPPPAPSQLQKLYERHS